MFVTTLVVDLRIKASTSLQRVSQRASTVESPTARPVQQRRPVNKVPCAHLDLDYKFAAENSGPPHWTRLRIWRFESLFGALCGAITPSEVLLILAFHRGVSLRRSF